jgi:RNA-directed DNA polymerase
LRSWYLRGFPATFGAGASHQWPPGLVGSVRANQGRKAYAWLCERRRDNSPHDDVWDLRWRWEEIRPQLQAQLQEGTYRLGPVRRFHRGDETIEVWSALDALVLEATALVLTAHWPPDLSSHCQHLPGRGGAKAAVRFVHEHLAANTFVFRTGSWTIG